jgi:hypothetical protein
MYAFELSIPGLCIEKIWLINHSCVYYRKLNSTNLLEWPLNWQQLSLFYLFYYYCSYSGSQLEVILLPSEHLAVSGDIFGCYNSSRGYFCHLLSIGTKHPTMHRAAPQQQRIT